MNSLRRQIKSTFTHDSFHAENTLITFSEPWNAKFLCSKTGWTTVEKFHVKFKFWPIEKHAAQKLILSYGDRISFRGISIHAWNMDTFIQIGDACGGFIDVDKTTIDM